MMLHRKKKSKFLFVMSDITLAPIWALSGAGSRFRGNEGA